MMHAYYNSSKPRYVDLSDVLDLDIPQQEKIRRFKTANHASGNTFHSRFRAIVLIAAKSANDITEDDFLFILDMSGSVDRAIADSSHPACYEAVKNTFANAAKRIIHESKLNGIVQPFIFEAPRVNLDIPVLSFKKAKQTLLTKKRTRSNSGLNASPRAGASATRRAPTSSTTCATLRVLSAQEADRLMPSHSALVSPKKPTLASKISNALIRRSMRVKKVPFN